jgi:hypothetical protein
MNTDAIRLLWTGGWDSSFRLLQIVVMEKKRVQPYYICDADRRSLHLELRAIKKILDLTRKTFPELSQNLLDPEFVFAEKEYDDSDICRYFMAYRSYSHIGEQYYWLSKFADRFGIYDLELSIEHLVPETIEGTWMMDVVPYLTGSGHECKVDYTRLTDEKAQLFKYYRWPVIHLTKTDMCNIARENGFLDIIKHSWFCHTPIRERPCGKCRPCRISKTDGNFTVHQVVPWYVTKADGYLTSFIRKMGII